MKNKTKFIKNAKVYIKDMQKYINLAKIEHIRLQKVYGGVQSDNLQNI